MPYSGSDTEPSVFVFFFFDYVTHDNRKTNTNNIHLYTYIRVITFYQFWRHFFFFIFSEIYDWKRPGGFLQNFDHCSKNNNRLHNVSETWSVYILYFIYNLWFNISHNVIVVVVDTSHIGICVHLSKAVRKNFYFYFFFDRGGVKMWKNL